MHKLKVAGLLMESTIRHMSGYAGTMPRAWALVFAISANVTSAFAISANTNQKTKNPQQQCLEL